MKSEDASLARAERELPGPKYEHTEHILYEISYWHRNPSSSGSRSPCKPNPTLSPAIRQNRHGDKARRISLRVRGGKAR